MFLSSIPVETGSNPNRPRPGRMWISNSYRVHQRICMAFDGPAPSSPARVSGCSHTPAPSRADADSILFRIEGPVRTRRGLRPRILVQSTREPNWDAAFHNAPFLIVSEDCCVKPYRPQVLAGDRFRFLLRANPTVTRNGKRHPIIPPADQIMWLRRKAEGSGFTLLSDPDLRDRGARYSRRSKHIDPNPHVHNAVTFTGILEVSETSRFLGALRNGIGPAKAYGFGLLSIARA